MEKLLQQLERGLNELSIPLNGIQQQKLLDYLYLLQKWNRKFNLTGVKNLEDMMVKHILDSLSVKNYIEGDKLIDVGSGAGLPGLPLAVSLPEVQVTLLDSNSKKTRFLVQAAMELNISNINVHKSRIQEYRPSHGFVTVISRAFTDLSSFYQMVQPICQAGGKIMVMKGHYPEEEIQSLKSEPIVATVHPIKVPGLKNEGRHLVVITKS